ncbi:MAG: hypothetical protein Rpha_0983 [Candidatus Ruthia sp. Apha_13_S6]|nr:hypothetical protein [Candidatus Ruthia sp. Apha_13_S6]
MIFPISKIGMIYLLKPNGDILLIAVVIHKSLGLNNNLSSC